MIESLVLIEGKQEQNMDKETLSSVSLMSAKHLVVGSVPGGGVILHVAANSPADLSNALVEFAKVPGVAEAVTLRLRIAD